MATTRRLVHDDFTERLSMADDPELTGEWPTERLARFIETDGFRWGLPQEFAGIEVTDAEMLEGYMDLARECLTTAFALTQRNVVCQRIAILNDLVRPASQQ